MKERTFHDCRNLLTYPTSLEKENMVCSRKECHELGIIGRHGGKHGWFS